MKKIILICCSIFLFSCATSKVVPLSKDSASLLNGKTISFVKYDSSANFLAMNFGRAAAGPMGAFAGLKEGEKLKAKYDLKDPEQYIGEKVMDILVNNYGMKDVSVAPIPVNRMDGPIPKVEEVAKINEHADYILLPFTTVWGYLYAGPFDFNHYKINYGAIVTLMDTKTLEEIAVGKCYMPSIQSGNYPLLDELLNENASLLKKITLEGADVCFNDTILSAFTL